METDGWLGLVNRGSAQYSPRLPENIPCRWRLRRRREWNVGKIAAYHGGTPRAGRDERQIDFGRVALDGCFWFEYDSRLSRKRDSEQD